MAINRNKNGGDPGPPPKLALTLFDKVLIQLSCFVMLSWLFETKFYFRKETPSFPTQNTATAVSTNRVIFASSIHALMAGFQNQERGRPRNVAQSPSARPRVRSAPRDLILSPHGQLDPERQLRALSAPARSRLVRLMKSSISIVP